MEETVWENIFRIFKENNIDIYPPATKQGLCEKEYIVLKNDGSSQIGNLSSEYNYYLILLYVPQNKYQELLRFKKKIKEIVSKKIYPLLVPTGLEEPDYFDDSIKAHMSTIQYRAISRNKQL